MRRRRAAAIIGLFGAAGAFGLAVVVSAGSARGDDRAATEAIIQELERDPAQKALTTDAVRSAREAIERATRLRSAGDETHAKLADGLAREHVETARDLARAAAAEKQAAEARRAAIDAGSQAERERALLEEGIAQNGRLRAELEEAERTGKEAPLKTNAAGAASAVSDAGAPVPKGAASKGGGAGGGPKPAVSPTDAGATK